MKVSVIISTYNNSEALKKCLWGYSVQESEPFDLIIADDGSRKDEYERIEALCASHEFPTKIVTQEDKGFRKTRILNRAILASKADLLIFSDSDIVPRNDFVSSHARFSKKGFYRTGGSHVNIPESIHRNLKKEDVCNGNLFDWKWLAEQGASDKKYRDRLAAEGVMVAVKNLLSWRSNAFAGCNASVWREDILRVNGFEEKIEAVGADDLEIGIRLARAGVKGRRYSYSHVCVHLDHPRPYWDVEKVKQNRDLIRSQKKLGATKAMIGISEAKG